MTEALLREIATLVGLVFSSVGLCSTALQMHRSRQFQRENTAKGIYRDYLKMATDNPVMADGDLKEIAKLELNKKYKWFVSYFLWACEEVIEFAPDDEAWRTDLDRQLSYHRAYLTSAEFINDELPFYSDGLKSLISNLSRVAR